MSSLNDNSKRLELIKGNRYVLYGGGLLSDVSLKKAVRISESKMYQILNVRDLTELLKDSMQEIPKFYKELLYLEQSMRKDEFLLHLFIFKPETKVIIVKENLKSWQP